MGAVSGRAGKRGRVHVRLQIERVFDRFDCAAARQTMPTARPARGHEAELYTRAVDIVVSRLRKKLEPLDCIKTLRNAGYSLALRRLVP